MNTLKRFSFQFEVSQAFLVSAANADRWVKACMASVAEQRTATGPRGGLYRLVTPPDEWQTSSEPGWARNTITYGTRRMGRYVPPSRWRPEDRPEVVSYGAFTVPVVDGKALLPSGRTVETDSRFVDVPVAPLRYRPLPIPDR